MDAARATGSHEAPHQQFWRFSAQHREYDGPKLGNEVKAEVHEVRRDKIKVDQLADLSGTMDVERPGPVISCISNSGGFMQSAMPEVDSCKLGNEVKAAMHEVRRDKTEASQSAGLSGTMGIEHRGNVGVTAGATAGKPQEHQAVQSAVPDLDGLKLGNEVKAEIHDVRQDQS